MGKLIVELPDDVHRELKKRSATDHRTIKDIISKLIDEYLYETARRTTVKKTGLCGSWDDDRTADEIIRDIKIHRRWIRRIRN